MAKDFNLTSLRGGLNNWDPPNTVADDQVIDAVNVEFNLSQLGERRKGSLAIASPAALTALNACTLLSRHLPTSDESVAELWAFGVTVGAAYTLQRRTTTWNTVTMSDVPAITGTFPFGMNAVSVHGKWFLSYKSSVDRLHVWDGTSLRRVGFATPVAPSAANAGVGTLSATRYGRVRYTTQATGVTLRRSEPSPVTSFTPSGSGASVVWTKPAAVNEGETHWELELSLDNVNFYVFATTMVGTAAVSDTQASTIGYSAFVLSATSGDYATFGSGKFLSVDNDRLMVGGSWDNEAMASRVAWSVVYGDITGQGNDERSPVATSSFLDLDAGAGGGLTALSGTIDGAVYGFKWGQIWRFTRTGQLERAYEAYAMTKQRGALPGSLVEAVDDAGRAVLFFLDPTVGPYRVGSRGLFWCGKDIKTTWERVNLEATQVVSRAEFYPEVNQVHFWVAVDGSNTPNLQLVLQLDAMVLTEDGLRKGWSTADGNSAKALTVTRYASNVDSANPRNKALVTLIGVASTTGAHIQVMNTGITDNGTPYNARLTTKPYSLSGLLNKFRLRSAALFAVADPLANVRISLVRDMGVETSRPVDTNLGPVFGEPHVVKSLDDLALSELKTAQMTISDVDTPSGTWQLNAISFKPSAEEQG